MTPNDIEVLIHCYCIPAPHPRCNAPAVRETLEMLRRDGFIEASATELGVYKTTSRGVAHILQICNLEPPTMVWLGVDGKVIAEV